MKTFDEVLTLADSMSLEEREDLVRILQSRLRDERRTELARDVAESRREFAEGKCLVATPDEIMRLARE